jgi:hypothetical protein
MSTVEVTIEVTVRVGGYGEWHTVEVTVEVTVRASCGEWHTVESEGW